MGGKISNIYTTTRAGNRRLTVGAVAKLAQAQARKAAENNTYGRYSRHYREPMIVTCRSWERSFRNIQLYVNPHEVRWTIPRRGTVTKTAAGTMQNVWRNRFRRTYFDEFTLNITFQAGNIMPFMAYPDQEFNNAEDIAKANAAPGIPPGLDNFYSFLELLDVPMLNGAGENNHIITHHSRAFPDITFIGFFQIDQPLSFPETSEDGNRLSWDATFQVYQTVPRISSYSALAARYRSFIQGAGRSEALPGIMDKSDPFYESVGALPTRMPAGQAKQVTANPLDNDSGFALLGAAGVTSGLKR